MPDLTPLTSLAFSRGRFLAADHTAGRLCLSLSGERLLNARVAQAADLELCPEQGAVTPEALWAGCYWVFAREPERQRVFWRLPTPPVEAVLRGVLVRTDLPDVYVCERSVFWQLPQPWLGETLAWVYPEQMIISAGKRHPRRALKPRGEVYRRYDTRLGAWVSLRALEIDTDLERFNRWQNHPRVAAFWQEDGSLEQHCTYLQAIEDDPHNLALIGCFDDQPFAYFEAYWAKEDRIAPFYDVGDYDRGIHMLVGEEAHRGPHKVASWLSALVHYLFLDDPRTQRVVAEPRADNRRMISHMQDQCFHCEKEFDFPHKRAALMILGRERFFQRCVLA